MEYALLVALIAVVCIGAVTFLGQSNSGKLQGAGDGLSGKRAGCTQVDNYVNPASQTPMTIHLYPDDDPPMTIPGACP